MLARETASGLPRSSPDARAAWLRDAGGVEAAAASGRLSEVVELPLVEALLIGLMRQGVTKFLAVFGHGSTAVAEMLRVYESHGLVRCWQFRNEVEMAHAATALSWVYGEVPAVVTSIGPGAFQAMAGSLAAASNGIGVYHLYGDETTHGEGYNMQQIPKPDQGLFGRITALMGASYTLHTPAALREALRKGSASVFHPWRASPFYLNLPLNTQLAPVTVRLDALPTRPRWPAPFRPGRSRGRRGRATDSRGRPGRNQGRRRRGSRRERRQGAGRGQRRRCRTQPAHGRRLARRASPKSPRRRHQGVDQRKLGDAGSRIVDRRRQSSGLPIGLLGRRLAQGPTRHQHQRRSDRRAALQSNPRAVGRRGGDVRTVGAALSRPLSHAKSAWLSKADSKEDGVAGAASRALFRPAAARRRLAAAGFDSAAGDRLRRPFLPRHRRAEVLRCRRRAGKRISDRCRRCARRDLHQSGASYMGFAVSALLSQALAANGRYGVAFTGDGSFMMCPQVLIDGVEHGARGTILLFDNRRMAAISSLQEAQFGGDYRTSGFRCGRLRRVGSERTGIKALSGGDSQESLRKSLEEAYAIPGSA